MTLNLFGEQLIVTRSLGSQRHFLAHSVDGGGKRPRFIFRSTISRHPGIDHEPQPIKILYKTIT